MTAAAELLPELLQRQALWRGAAPAAKGPAARSTGFAALDAQLPGGGWPSGSLVDLFCQSEGVGELQVVLPALASLTASGRRVAWLAPPHLPYAPALRAAGVRLEHLTVIRAPGRRDALWAAEQALRSGAFHALLAWLPRSDYTELRRLAVAAQSSPGFAALFRPPQAAGESSPAALQLSLEPVPAVPDPEAVTAGRLAVRILKRRGAPLAEPVRLPIRSPVASFPAASSREARAHALGRTPFPAAAPAGAGARACAA